MNKKPEHFTKFPSKYIQGDIKTKFGVSRKFYITYILINKYRSYEDYSWITVGKILAFYGYKPRRNKPKAFGEVLDVLEYMVKNNMIELLQDLDSVDYDTGIEIKIIPENFDPHEKFCIITSSQLNTIMKYESGVKKENLLMVFLYINSYIYIRAKDMDEYAMPYPSQRPEAFWKSINNMAKELSMSKSTISQCIDCLTTLVKTSEGETLSPLLIKREVNNIQLDDKKASKIMPNIYVMNKDGYEKEIKCALYKILEIYKVGNFETGGE